MAAAAAAAEVKAEEPAPDGKKKKKKKKKKAPKQDDAKQEAEAAAVSVNEEKKAEVILRVPDYMYDCERITNQRLVFNFKDESWTSIPIKSNMLAARKAAREQAQNELDNVTEMFEEIDSKHFSTYELRLEFTTVIHV